jgi:ankyrin repeat protein
LRNTPCDNQASENSTQLIPGKGEMACFTPIQTSPLLALPTEILVYLLHYLRDSATPLLLSTTCHQLRTIYQDKHLYKTQDRQLHRFVYTLNTPALYDALYAKLPNKKLNINLPDPYTSDWTQLRNCPLPLDLGSKTLQTAFIQKTYLITWELLLQAEEKEFKDEAYILRLMQIIGKLSPHIDNVESYTEKLFNSTFPKLWLEKLIAISLDWGLQLICTHFASHTVRPLVSELDPALAWLLNNRENVTQWQFTASYLTGKPYPSFLPYALERFYLFGDRSYLFGNQANVEFTHPDIKALLEKMLSNPEVNYNARDEEEKTLLIAACQNNDETLVNRYLQQPNIDTQASTDFYPSFTALDWAVKNEAVAIIQALLTYGVAETTHIKAFNYAIELQKSRIVHILWQRAKDRRSFIEQALKQAITAKKAEVAYQLVKQCPQAAPADYSLLSVALEELHFLLVNWLLFESELKFTFNHESDKTLLHNAVTLRNYPQEKLTVLIKHLLKSGADCNVIDDHGYTPGYTPLMLACKYGQEEIVALLLQQPSINVNIRGTGTSMDFNGGGDISYETSALRCAVGAERINIVKALLEHEIDVADRVSAFNLAVEKGQETMATLLLQSVSVLDQQDFIEQALTQAITEDLGIVLCKLIKNYQGDPNTTDEAGSSALTVALEHEYSLLFDILLNHPNFVMSIGKGKDGKTALHYHSSMSSIFYSDQQLTQLITLFIEQGGNYNLTDEEGNTPLMLACKASREAVVNVLLQQSYLDINIRNKQGKSALQYAVNRGSESIVQALLKYEIEQDDLFAAFSCAIQLKREGGREEIIDMLRQSYPLQDFINQALSWTLRQAEKINDFYERYFSSIDQLIEEGADPNALAGFYPAVFNIALRVKNMIWLDQLLQTPELTIAIEKDYCGNTPLHYAVLLGKEYSYEKTAQLISRLFTFGVDGNAVDKEGNTALILACQHYPALALLLLQQPSIDMNIKNGSGYSALDLAIQQNNRPLLDALLKHDIRSETLADAFNYALFLNKKKALTRVSQALEEKGIEVNQVLSQALAETRFDSTSVIGRLIDECGADPDTVDECGNALLNKALKCGDHALIDRVLARPTFNVNVTHNHNTALLYAIKLDYPKEQKLLLVKRLLEQGADCNASNEKGENPLIAACEREQEKLVHILLQQPAIDIRARNKSNKSVLDYAIKHNMTSVVQVLLNHSLPADHYFSAVSQAIIWQRDDLLTLLWHKVENRQAFINQVLSWVRENWQDEEELLSIIYILIKEYDADPNTLDKAGCSPLAFALVKSDIVLLDMLLAHPKLRINPRAKDEKGRTLLHLAIPLQKYPVEKHLALMERLLKAGADCNATAKGGWTPLMALARYNKKQLLPLLLQYGPDSNAKTTEGFSALDSAICYASNSFVSTILEYGVNTDTLLNAFSTALQGSKSEIIDLLWSEVQQQQDFNHRALSFAISQNHAEAAYQLIKKYHADPNTMNMLGFSALNVALREAHIPLLNILLSCSDFKVNVEKDSEGSTALMYALALDMYVEERRIPLVKYLLASGADYNFVNIEGKTPLILTCSTNQFELTKLLLQYVPNINTRDNKGNSALDYAVLHGTVNLIQVLLTCEVAPDTLLSAFNQAVHFNKDSMAEILLNHAKRQGNELFVHQALAWAQDKGQQEVIQ